MASRYTKVQSSIWQSRKYRKAKEYRLEYVYLLSCPHGNSAGLFRFIEGYAIEDLMCSGQRIKNALKCLEDVGLIKRDGELIFIYQFLKWNPIMNPNHANGTLNEIRDYIKSPLYNLFLNDLETFCQRFIELFPNSCETVSEQLPNSCYTETETETYTETETDIYYPSDKPPEINELCFGEFQKVKMKQKEYDNLLEKYGRAIVDDKIAYLDANIKSRVKKYLGFKDHYATIGNWCRAEIARQQPRAARERKIDPVSKEF